MAYYDSTSCPSVNDPAGTGLSQSFAGIQTAAQQSLSAQKMQQGIEAGVPGIVFIKNIAKRVLSGGVASSSEIQIMAAFLLGVTFSE